MPRTDVHRPSAINPADYRFVAFDYLRQVAADDQPLDMSGCTWLQSERETIRQDMVRTRGDWSTHAHGGNCMVCGNANALYTAAFHHAPTNSYVRMGSDCSHHVNASLDHEAFLRFRNRVSNWLTRENRFANTAAELVRRGLESLVQFTTPTDVLPTDDNRRIASDIVYRLAQHGSLSDRQWAFLRVLAHRIAGLNLRPNQYAATCTRCGTTVPPNVGAIERVDGRWTVHHLEGQCPPPVAPPPAPAPTIPAAAQNVPAASVGELAGIMTLFDRARAHLQHPTIVLNVPGWNLQHGIRITVAGATARVPGSLNVVYDQPGGGRRPWLGRVLTDGVFAPSHGLAEGQLEFLRNRLREFAADPARVAGEAGRLAGRCCFCRLPLTDARSTAVGYGATCAGHYGLPWGERPTEFAASVANTGNLPPRFTIMPDAARTTLTERVIMRARELPQRQLDLHFDAAAERTRRVRSGHECPACEGINLHTDGEHRWRCLECGTKWSTQ